MKTPMGNLIEIDTHTHRGKTIVHLLIPNTEYLWYRSSAFMGFRKSLQLLHRVLTHFWLDVLLCGMIFPVRLSTWISQGFFYKLFTKLILIADIILNILISCYSYSVDLFYFLKWWYFLWIIPTIFFSNS